MEGPKDYVRRRIATTQEIVCAAPAYLKKWGVPQKPSDLTKHPILMHSGAPKLVNTLLFKGDTEVTVQPIAYFNDAKALVECTINGMGISKLRDYMMEQEIAKGRLVEILPSYRTPAQSIYLYYQANRYLQPKIRSFIDFYF